MSVIISIFLVLCAIVIVIMAIPIIVTVVGVAFYLLLETGAMVLAIVILVYVFSAILY